MAKTLELSHSINVPNLKPCPFCGSKAAIYPTTMTKDNSRDPKFYMVGCDTCICVGSHATSRLYETKENAILAWNGRRETKTTTVPPLPNPRDINASNVAGFVEDWVNDHTEESAKQIVYDYYTLMERILNRIFGLHKSLVNNFVDNACVGEWGRLGMTDAEERLTTTQWRDMLLDEIWQYHNVWTWDNVIRVQWIYQHLCMSFYSE